MPTTHESALLAPSTVTHLEAATLVSVVLCTGTLTENRMTVVAGWFAGRLFHDSVPGPTELNPTVLQEIKLNCAMNSKVQLLTEGSGRRGSVCDGVLLSLMVELGGRGGVFETQSGDLGV